MLNSIDTAIDTTLYMLSGAIITIGGKKFQVKLDEYIEKKTFNLSSILLFTPKQEDTRKRINPYRNWENSLRQYKIMAYYMGSYYIYRHLENINQKDLAQRLMCQYFNIDDKKEFTACVTEFRNLERETTRGKQISKQTEDIYYNYACFTNDAILKILTFCLYHPYEFNIDIDFDRIEDAFFIK